MDFKPYLSFWTSDCFMAVGTPSTIDVLHDDWVIHRT